MTQQNRRDHFRIEYPRNSGPSLLTLGHTIPILNVSERGIKLLLSTGPLTRHYKVGSKLAGFITFQTGERVFVSGSVIWTTPESLSLKLSIRISYQLILSEQRRLITQLRQQA
ncbi:MAG: PilZ domain-containing protein [Bdellovibrionales bacterium]|nr:PilZ domain-containing protein [Bdellovibrionales bacterium]